MPKPVVNIAASVRQRLLELARKRGADFQLILIQYAVERLLYRFSRSAYRDRFILKGAMPFSAWSEELFDELTPAFHVGNTGSDSRRGRSPRLTTAQVRPVQKRTTTHTRV